MDPRPSFPQEWPTAARPPAVNSLPYRGRPACADCGFCSSYPCPTNAKGSMGRAEATVEGKTIASIGRVIYGHHPAANPEEARRRFACYGDLA